MSLDYLILFSIILCFILSVLQDRCTGDRLPSLLMGVTWPIRLGTGRLSSGHAGRRPVWATALPLTSMQHGKVTAEESRFLSFSGVYPWVFMAAIQQDEAALITQVNTDGACATSQAQPSVWNALHQLSHFTLLTILWYRYNQCPPTAHKGKVKVQRGYWNVPHTPS